MTFKTRFAPSPTGPLHLGHAFSALTAYEMARQHSGVFHLRIEDIDQSRCRTHWEDEIFSDLSWLGISWSEPVMRQSNRLEAYHAALDQLWAMGLLYDCNCRRRDILAAASAPHGSVALGPDGVIYPGTCRRIPAATEKRPRSGALRLNMSAALERLNGLVSFEETGSGPDGQNGVQAANADDMLRNIGDVVLARRDMGTSYHLAVVVDDALQNITDVVRGQDLFDATHIHVLLQGLLSLPTPRYHHHRLILDDAGKRLAKRDDARAISTYRQEGLTPGALRGLIGMA